MNQSSSKATGNDSAVDQTCAKIGLRCRWWIVGLSLLDVCRWGWLAASPSPLIVADAAQYWQLGQSVAEGNWLLQDHEIAYRTPGYPWFVAAIQSVFGTQAHRALIVAQGICLSLTTIVTAALAWKMTRRQSAVVAAMLLNFVSLSRATYITVALTETLFTLLLMIHLWVVARFSLAFLLKDNAQPGQSTLPAGPTLRGQLVWAGLVGISWSLLVLVRPIALYLPLAHLLIGVIFYRQLAIGAVMRAIPVMATASLLIMLPWLMRNQEMFGRPLITEFVGRNVWIVTFQDGAAANLDLPSSPEADDLRKRVLATKDEADLRRTWQVSEGLRASGLNDVEADRLMRTVATQAIREQPLPWFSQAARRFVNYWRCVSDDLPVIGNNAPSHHLWLNQLVMLVLSASIFAGLFSKKFRPWSVWLGLILAYFGSVTALLEVPDYRYRMIVEPVGVLGISLLVGLLGTKPLNESH